MPYKDLNKRRAYNRWWCATKERSPESKERKKKYDRERASLPKRRESHLIYIKRHPEKLKMYRRNYLRKCRLKAIEHYSNGTNSCSCCGEKHIEFLSFDHINGGGKKDRDNNIKGKYSTIGVFLVRKNFPSGYRILCFNCNLSRGFYGYCPHE